MRITRPQMFMDIAEVLAKRSACLRNNVGCVIVNNSTHNIVSCGYNGPAAGIEPCIKCKGKGCDIAIHAEDNALQRLNEQSFKLNDCYSLFVTVSPCLNCAKLIANNNRIQSVYYRYEYRDRSGIVYLLSKGIRVYRLLSGGIINEEKL